METQELKQTQTESIFSPRFKTVAAMAGWDEETLLSASLIVDDTPDSQLTLKKRTVFPIKTPPTTNSRKKRRVQRSPVPIVALDLNDIELMKNETQKDDKDEKNETEVDTLAEKNSDVSCSTTSLPCMEKLREELSCAICLDICFEPSTTPCGHSFCMKCLRYSASKCGKKCPKCRQLISNGKYCTVNTVLWNTIQLLFPKEVEAKKGSGALNSCEKIPQTAIYEDSRNGSSNGSEVPTREETATRRRRRATTENQNRDGDHIASMLPEISRSIQASSRAPIPSQDSDAAFALRLQREEIMGAVRGGTSRTTRLNQSSSSAVSLVRERRLDLDSSSTTRTNSSFSSARANLRAMASRAVRARGWNL